MVRSVEAQQGFGDAGNDIVVDELLLAAGGVSERCGREAVYFAERALRELVQGRERVIGEEGAVGPGSGEPKTHVFGSVFDGQQE